MVANFKLFIGKLTPLWQISTLTLMIDVIISTQGSRELDLNQVFPIIKRAQDFIP